jgi:histidyl-tRNA synthetase
MALSTQPYKGARDFYPEDKRRQKYIFNVWRKVVERYGYEEYDAPIIEPIELYLAKSGEEIVNEQTYTFTDRGDRQVVIRPEMTPTVSRMVAGKRQELALPLRWYSIPNLWRYERPQRGRLREHWQLNVDLFGIADEKAEYEIIQVADAIMQAFKAKRDMYSIKLNSRKLMDAFLHEHLGLDETQTHTMVKLIDRMHKIDKAEFIGQADAIFTPSQRDARLNELLFRFLEATSADGIPVEIKHHPSVLELQTLFNMLHKAGIANVVFDPTIMRGFDYYTDIVFEVFDAHPENNRSMFGGGRYDGLVGLFGVEPLPTIGFGMGDVTLTNFLELHNLNPALRPETDMYVILIGDLHEQVQPILKDLRQMGVNIAVDNTGRKPDKAIKTAVKKGIHYALFIGEKELADERYMLKNLQTGEEERHGVQRLVSIVKDYRKNR